MYMKKVFLYILLFIPAIIVSIFSEKTPIDILAEFVQMDFKELAVLLKDVKVLQTVLLLSVAVNAVLLFILHKSIQARYVEPTETTVASEASVPTTSDPTDKPIPTTSTSTEATEATEATEPTASTEKEAIRVGTLISFGHYQQDSGALSDP